MKTQFTNKIAQEIAKKSFSYTLDCILGYGDREYSLEDDSSTFEQDFEEDLEERGIEPTLLKIKIISKYYDKMVEDCKKYLRKKYYK